MPVNVQPSADLEVVVLDEDPIVRRAVVGALQSAAETRVVGDGADNEHGVRLALELEPDVVILDAQLQLSSGCDSLRALRDGAPRTRVLLFSSVEDDELGLRALRMGASGVLSKQVGLEALPRIVKSLGRGEAVLSRRLTMRLIERLREVPESGGGLRPVRSDLSSREWEVLDLMCAGGSTKSIASELRLSVETVRSHVKRILRKLGAHSRGEAIAKAARLLEEHAHEPSPRRSL